MTLWQDEFKQKSITAQEAANLIKSGNHIMTGNRDCRAILRKLAERKVLRYRRLFVRTDS